MSTLPRILLKICLTEYSARQIVESLDEKDDSLVVLFYENEILSKKGIPVLLSRVELWLSMDPLYYKESLERLYRLKPFSLEPEILLAKFRAEEVLF